MTNTSIIATFIHTNHPTTSTSDINSLTETVTAGTSDGSSASTGAAATQTPSQPIGGLIGGVVGGVIAILGLAGVGIYLALTRRHPKKIDHELVAVEKQRMLPKGETVTEEPISTFSVTDMNVVPPDTGSGEETKSVESHVPEPHERIEHSF
jgi:hypothetical protein